MLLVDCKYQEFKGFISGAYTFSGNVWWQLLEFVEHMASADKGQEELDIPETDVGKEEKGMWYT